MTNVIWQTYKGNNSILSDETNGQLEFITKVILKDVEHVNHFDNKEYKTIINNSIIIYSAPLTDIDPGMKNYLAKYKSKGYKYILMHLSNESLRHNCCYYSEAQHVFRFHHDVSIKYPNVTTLPLGFISGYMNSGGTPINLSDKRDISVVFIGQVKADRQLLVNNITPITNNFIYLTKQWNDPNLLTFDKVIEIYKRTKFVPCPMGWISPDSLRLFEALEWGCVPIIKKYNGIDYYQYIFGKHPIPIINEWTEIGNLIKQLDNDKLDDLILSINKWYKEHMESVAVNVSNIVNENLKQYK